MCATRCGLVTVLGRTNVGKSTLVNRIVGAKVSIVTDRTQTTMRSVHGVLTEGESQAVFVDTPGLHRPVDRHGVQMIHEIRRSLEGIDLVLAVVEPGDRAEGGTRHLIGHLEKAGSPKALLVINKIDRVSPGSSKVRRTVEALSEVYPFVRAYPVSATAGSGVKGLVEEILSSLPAAPFEYPREEVSNLPQTFYAAELIREKAMEATREEIPHAIAVEIEELSRDDAGSFTIRAVLSVDRESRKGILIGSGGQRIKEIGMRARLELEEILEAPVHLMTRVVVVKDWRKQQRRPGGI